MGKVKYRLQSVMDARERLKQEAARAVALRRSQLEEAEKELARRVADLENRVYVEPQADGTVNLTQRGYTLPPDYGGPGPSVLTYPGVSTLAPGKTARETLRVRAPKTRQHPYGRYYPEVQVPDPLRRVRFCLGVVPGDAQTKATRGARVLTSLQAVAAQELLCGEPQELD